MIKRISAEHRIYSMDRTNPPALEVEDGDQIEFETLDALDNLLHSMGSLPPGFTPTRSNPATGPVRVRGAEPGDALDVEILEINFPADGHMWVRQGLGLLNPAPPQASRRVRVSGGMACFSDDLAVPLRPMVGVIGVAPTGTGVPTHTPGVHGGNIDVTSLGPGATISLPVQVSGAMLALGDVHAAMGDGELSGTGVEIPALVRVRVGLRKGRAPVWPVILNQTHLSVVVSDSDLMRACRLATEAGMNLLVRNLGLPSSDAYMLLGASADMRICQLVNPLPTVRLDLPRSVLRGAAPLESC